MSRANAEIVREYGPFPGSAQVHGVTYDGERVWFAAGDRINAFDPESGEPLRSIDVAAHAGTAFDGEHLFQLAENRIQKIDPKSGRVLAHDSIARRGGDSGWRGRKARSGWGSIGAGRSTSRSRDRRDPAHHRVEPLRDRRHLGRRRPLARAPGKAMRATCGASIHGRAKSCRSSTCRPASVFRGSNRMAETASSAAAVRAAR
jgi:hypothetical protein